MGFRISDLVKAMRVLGDFPLETVDTTEPNAAKKSKHITLDQVRDYVLTGLPPQPAKWVTQPEISVPVVSGMQATFTVSAGQAQWPEGLVDYLSQEFTVDLPGPGLQRIDTVVADPQGGFVLVSGDSSQNPAPKKQPVDTLWVNFVLFNEEGAEVPPPQGIDFNYASYTGKATPADTAVFLVQESSGTKYKWSLSQLITWLGTKNIGGMSAEPQFISFTPELKFAENLYYRPHLQDAPLNFTLGALGNVAGNIHVAIITTDGVSPINFSDDFDFIYGITNGQPLAAGTYEFYFHYKPNGKVTVNVPTSTQAVTPEAPAPNTAPSANAGVDQSVQEGAVVTLNGAGADTDGSIASYSWSQVSGPNTASITSPGSATTTVTGTVAGTYVFRLTVTDDQGATATDDVTLTVSAATGDTTAPTAPGTPTYTNITETSATASWTAATDNVGVAGYNIYVDGVKKN